MENNVAPAVTAAPAAQSSAASKKETLAQKKCMYDV